MVRLRGALVAVCLVAVLAGCTHAGPSVRSFPALDAAARERLEALSAGWVRGDPATAASLSTGDVAVRDAASASALGAQERSGDTTDFAFDVLSVVAHPLDGGATDFVAYEKVRSHGTGVASDIVELYHRDNTALPWKAAYRAYFADNIDLPSLGLDHAGAGHLLTAGEMAGPDVEPSGLATRYAAAVDAASAQAAAFQPGQFTTGEVTDARDLANSFRDHGAASRQWLAQPGGAAVAVTGGVLVFANLQRTEVIQQDAEGTLHYFVVQDASRVNFGGLLAPGRYADVTSSASEAIAVVVTPSRPPDVVGRDVQVVSIEGQLSPA